MPKNLRKQPFDKEMAGESGLYLHIPFCANKCIYCDFYSGGVRIARWPDFIRALTNELKFRINSEPAFQNPTTLYIGGGTPSLIPSDIFAKLMVQITHVTGKGEWKEFTIEVNPEDVSEEKCMVWKQYGVNRVSMGIQTLDDTILKRMGRRHTATQALDALEILKKWFKNISVDLMFALPGQTLESYSETLSTIISRKPEHISSYSLMKVKGTALAHLYDSGKIFLPEEEEWENLSNITISTLSGGGYLHYEISNFALPGYESVHNSGYWTGKPYLGIGPSAHSYDGVRTRSFNPNDIKGYVDGWNRNPTSPLYSEEVLSDEELREEMIMMRLRMSAGLAIDEFRERFGEKEKERLLTESSVFLQKDLLSLNRNTLCFTEKGIRISDSILAALI